MAKLLYIKANPKGNEESRTFKISEAFIEEYIKHHPDDEIITLDLYKEQIPFLNKENINEIFSKKDPSNIPPLLKYAYEFKEVDKYVIAEPLWNLSIPSILKAYIDLICVTGVTFKYTENGPVGLCTNKKAVNITTRGGNYEEPPMSDLELGDRYLKTIFGFLGITNYKTISANELDVIGKDIDQIVNQAITEAKNLAKDF